MEKSLKVLILEDDCNDAEIIQDIIVKAGMHCSFHLATDKDSFVQALSVYCPEVILSDNSLPQFNSEEALIITRQIYPHVPFILVTGTVSEEYAVKMTKSGADDYILKDRLARLPAAIGTALHHRQAEIQKELVTLNLVQSEEKYRTLVSRITDAFIALDQNWNFTYLNRHAAELVQLDAAEVIGKNIWQLLPDTIGSATYDAFHLALRDQQYICMQDYYPPLDLWQENHIYPSTEGLSVFIRNISETKKAEKKLREAFAEKEILAGRMYAILNTIPANIALLDSTGLIIDVNDAWKKFALENGYADTEHGIGGNYITISKRSIGEEKKDGIKVASGIKAVLENQLKEFVFEYSCHSTDLKRWFRMIVTPLSEKSYSGAVVMHIDITEIRKLEQERLENKINEQKKMTKAILLAQEKERNVIGSELHDNVNQILAGIKLLLSTGQVYPEKKEELINSAIANVQYAIDENRKIAHELVAPDFKEIRITEQLNILAEGMLKQGGIDITIEANGFREELLDDEQKLAIYRIAQEQCTNILKHAGATSVSISLSIVAGKFEMKITDNGRGVKEGRLVKGIGLKNIRSRLDLFNGEIHIETAPGKGFELGISMPLNK